MKRLILIALFFVFTGFSQIAAQLEIGYVDSDAIMEQLPDAQDAQKKIDAVIAEWQEELDKMQQKWENKYDQYQKRKLIMSDQKRVEVEQELVDLENQISQFRQEKFGVNGELFDKQEEIMEPVNNKIFNAIQEVAKERKLDFVFDRSGDILFLYAKEEYDITSLVLEKLK